MRRWGAAGAEIVRRCDQAAAEMPLPDAIDEDSRGEWIGGVGQPLCQFFAATGIGVLKLLAAENIQELAGDFVSQVGRLAPFLQASVLGLAFGDGIADRDGQLRSKVGSLFLGDLQGLTLFGCFGEEAREVARLFFAGCGRVELVEVPADSVRSTGMSIGDSAGDGDDSVEWTEPGERDWPRRYGESSSSKSAGG